MIRSLPVTRIILLFIVFTSPELLIASAETDSLLRALNHNKGDSTGLKILIRLSSNLINEGDYNTSRKYAKKAILMADQLLLKPAVQQNEEYTYKCRELRGSATQWMGIAYASQSNNSEALRNFFDALSQFERIGYKKGIAYASGNIGAIGVEQGDYSMGLKYDSLAFKMKVELQDSIGIATCFQNFGELFRHKGDYRNAMKNYLQALKIFEQTGAVQGVGMCYNNMALISEAQGHNDEALIHFFKALKLFRETGFSRGVDFAYNNIGAIYKNKKNYPEALKYHTMSFKLKQEQGDKNGMAISLQNISIIYTAQKRYAEALKNNEEALSIFKEAGNQEGIVDVCGNNGEVNKAMGHYGEALSWLLKAQTLAEKIGYNSARKSIYYALSEIYETQNNYKKALTFHKLFMIQKDSLFNLENSRQIAELKTKYQSEKKDQYIAVLNKDKIIQQSEIQQQRTLKETVLAGTVGIVFFSLFSFLLYKRKRDADLKQQQAAFQLKISELDMKALRAQMNPHFIFNSLRSVNEYIQSHQPDMASEYLIKFSKLMRAILENSRQKEIALSKELDLLVLYMQLESRRMEHPFEYSFEIDPQLDPETILIPSMLLQPVIENSIWHGLAPKDEPGKIIIRIKKDKEMIQYEVEDNGIGKTPSHSFNNNDASKSGSFGLKIMEDRLDIIEQLFKIKTHLIFRNLQSNGSMQGHLVSFRIPFENSL